MEIKIKRNVIEIYGHYDVQKYNLFELKKIEKTYGNWIFNRKIFFQNQEALLLTFRSGRRVYVRSQIQDYLVLKNILSSIKN